MLYATDLSVSSIDGMGYAVNYGRIAEEIVEKSQQVELRSDSSRTPQKSVIGAKNRHYF